MIQFITGVARYIIFFLNFIFVVFGALLILFGLLPIVNGGYDSTYSKIAIAVGSIVFIISFLGCCGAVRENRNLLTAHAVILILMFILQIIVILVVILADINDSYGNIDDKLSKFIYSTNEDELSIVRDLEKWLGCCGVHNSTDYTDRGWPLPGSCCGESDDVDSKNQRTCIEGKEYTDGCGPKFRDYIKDNYKYVTCIVIGSAVFELFAGIFTLWTRDHLSK
ncbi:tetraspanin-3-like [Coccinella septempunctata]|uniref:tetraspanin-3-like n=1 Tax=Coccinella septempunctata TaxID=41139 RepID=UPI001D096E77|nr:tetraspanin-3-like [Coccinella septempunctata]